MSCFEGAFGDFLYLFASLGGCWREDLSDFARHGPLTFGAVVGQWRGVLAYFPSTPFPEWHFEDRTYGMKANYSEKGRSRRLHTAFVVLTHAVTSRVDFHLQRIPSDTTHIRLSFSLRLPKEEGTRHRAAYLSQHSYPEPNIRTCR